MLLFKSSFFIRCIVHHTYFTIPVKTIKNGKTQVKKTNLDKSPDDWNANSGHRDRFIVFRDIGTSFRDNQDEMSGQSGQAKKVHKVKSAKKVGGVQPQKAKPKMRILR